MGEIRQKMEIFESGAVSQVTGQSCSADHRIRFDLSLGMHFQGYRLDIAIILADDFSFFSKFSFAVMG